MLRKQYFWFDTAGKSEKRKASEHLIAFAAVQTGLMYTHDMEEEKKSYYLTSLHGLIIDEPRACVRDSQLSSFHGAGHDDDQQ